MIVISAIILNEKKIEQKEESKEEKVQIPLAENSNSMDSSFMDKQETRSTFSYNDSYEKQTENKKEENPQELSLSNQIAIFWSFLKTDKRISFHFF